MSLYCAAGMCRLRQWSASARPKNSLGQPSIWPPTPLSSSSEQPWSWMEAFWQAASINNCAQREE